ncbi:MAG: UDP-N-acetylmuramoyl-L-alanyl-D-glutamate--2,6-diaminopimelate ligase [Clostridiales bacterium]|jgi:UDP-N-acetylmuramoyl-L-alanyl-D-glutamate--2,6-diaminopimelate ligase|nr:UDP-N-acetylmuramoyl-L-alanyl-D-glutamate--2,6-diaminopimelate ligase [Clostridiales bacterium]
MTLKEILKGLEYEWVQGRNAEVSGIAIDSRKVQYDSLFVCLKGLRSDGHHFIAKAAQAGASAVLVQDSQEDYPENVTAVKTDDTRKALSYAAANFFGNPSQSFNLVGVTGTKGKTTTTYLLENILRECGRKVGVIGTLGAKIGPRRLDIHYDTSTTPDPVELQQILSVMKEEKISDAVMEVSSQALAFHKVDGVKFNIGIFTNLSQDHLDFHKTMENYQQAKAKLFTQCRYGVVNADSEAGLYMTRQPGCEYMTFSIDAESDLRAENIQYLENGLEFTARIHETDVHFFVPIKGRFTVYNTLGAIGAALLMNIPVESIQNALAVMKGVPGRLQSVPNSRGLHVIVDYAHSPDSLVNIINAVREFTQGKLVTLFGCGGDRDALKRPIMGKIAGELSDYCIITSDNPRGEPPGKIMEQIESGLADTHCPYESVLDRKDAIFRAVSLLEEGDSLIVAGKGHEDYQIIGDQILPFDDMKITREALAALEARA